MIFTPQGKYGMLSDCKRYSVAAYREPVAGGWIYQAWHCANTRNLEILHTGTDPDCRQACVEHAHGRA